MSLVRVNLGRRSRETPGVGVFGFETTHPPCGGRTSRSCPQPQAVRPSKGHHLMTRLSLLAVLAIGATLIVAPTASAKPLGLVQIGDAQAHHAAGHAPKPRCAHNGASTNTAGHLNCRRHPTETTTGDPAPV